MLLKYVALYETYSSVACQVSARFSQHPVGAAKSERMLGAMGAKLGEEPYYGVFCSTTVSLLCLRAGTGFNFKPKQFISLVNILKNSTSAETWRGNRGDLSIFPRRSLPLYPFSDSP